MPKGLVYRNGNYEFVENVEELADNDYQHVLSMDDVLGAIQREMNPPLWRDVYQSIPPATC